MKCPGTTNPPRVPRVPTSVKALSLDYAILQFSPVSSIHSLAYPPKPLPKCLSTTHTLQNIPAYSSVPNKNQPTSLSRPSPSSSSQQDTAPASSKTPPESLTSPPSPQRKN